MHLFSAFLSCIFGNLFVLYSKSYFWICLFFFFLPSIDCFSMYSLCSPLPQAQIIASWCDLFKKWYIQQYVCTLRIIDRRAGEVVAPLQITDLRKPLVWTFCPALIYGAPAGRRVGLVARISRSIGLDMSYQKTLKQYTSFQRCNRSQVSFVNSLLRSLNVST